jgi:ABC-type dipeptide/oligopeptide/nickel transport system ATPase subunit
MATLPERQFQANDAKREHVPLLIGLTGPSGGGKTYSALRLATGIQQVTGGDIYFIDTESRRALHYADQFKFKHVPFTAPFGSLDYLAALQFCVKQGAKVVIVDSMSHEHEGPGGMVDLHDQLVDKMAGTDFAKRERVKMLAWSEPKQKRRQLINGILQLNANFIFCFRAKNSSKPVKGANGRTEVEALGFMPIAGEEFVFEQTLNALLLPAAGGVPSWDSQQIGERTMIKLPEQFASLRDYKGPLDEKVGKKLALWAAGKARPGAQEQLEPVEDRSFEVTDSGEAVEQSDEPDEKSAAEQEVAKVIERARAATKSEALEKIIAETEPHKAFMPDALAIKLEIVFDEERKRFAEPELAE